MRRAYSKIDGERLDDEPRGDPTRRLLRLDVEFGGRLPTEGINPPRDAFAFPSDESSRAFCVACLGVAASFLVELMAKTSNDTKEGNRRVCEKSLSLVLRVF